MMPMVMATLVLSTVFRSAVIGTLVVLLATIRARVSTICTRSGLYLHRRSFGSPTTVGVRWSPNATSTSGC